MFFANSLDKPIDTKVALRGKKNLVIWNPHTGEREKTDILNPEAADAPVTTVRLSLPALASRFYIQE